MATTQNQRERLAMAGFVRVDGLICHRGATREVIKARPGEEGCYGISNGKLALVTIHGEIWLGGDRHGGTSNGRYELLRELCNIGKGAFVPCSNGEFIFTDDILTRLVNPDWMP